MSVCLDYQSNHSALCASGSIVQLPNEAPMVHQDTNDFKDICVVKVINKAKFPVYLVNNKGDRKDYAMKVFGYAGNKPHPYFQNEARFSFLDHPNVIRTQYIENERETISQGCKKKVSYTIMEYAPYGDFFDLMINYGTRIDDKLIRTYFRQLIKGVEYLHSNGVSHMDLKLENLLVGEKFELKIADFDLSFLANDQRIVSKGTKFYRAPELIRGRCLHTESADIYSLGVVLFTMKSRGMLPHAEENSVNGVDFAWLLYNNNQEFWKEHCKIQKKGLTFFDHDFKTLFNALIKLNPKERASIAEIKQSVWYNGPYYTDEELRDLVSDLMKINK